MEEQQKRPYQILSGNALKLIAIIVMLIDHTAVVMIENGILKELYGADFYNMAASPELNRWLMIDLVMRMVGRLAFPIFCYLIVEGFFHTRDVKKYAQRLFLFALISEIPFDLAVWGEAVIFTSQNVYFTLFFGLVAMVCLEKYGQNSFMRLVITLAAASGAQIMHTDYGAFGVLFIILLYLMRNDRKKQFLWGCLAVSWELTAPLSFIPIAMYNGTRGKLRLKYLFYWFYPVHLLVLWLISVCFM